MAAMPRISKAHRILSMLAFNPNARLFAKPRFSTVAINVHLSSEQAQLADELVSVFNGRPFLPQNPELKRLAPFLTTKLVESALTRFKNWRTAHSFFTWASTQKGYCHNCYTYNAMASILSGARQNAALSALASELVDSSSFTTPGGLGFFLRRLGDLGLVEEANAVFDHVKNKCLCVPNDYTYACLFEVLSKCGSIELLETRLSEMKDSGLQMSKYSLAPLLRGYCLMGKFEEALEVFDEMDERGWADAHVFSVLIVCFSKSGKVEKAFEWIERMEERGFQLNATSYHVLINGFAKESRVEMALQLFAKMRSSGFSVNVSLFDVLIGGLCKNKEFEKALCLFEEMKSLGIRPDAGILGKLVSCCSSEGEMIGLLDEKEQDMGTEELILLYSAVLNGLIKLGSIDKVHTLLRSMIDGKSTLAFDVNNMPLKVIDARVTSCFRQIIDGLLKVNKVDMALKLFKDMIHIGCKPGRPICNNLINELCNSDRLEESYEIVTEMKNSGLEPTEFTYNSLYWCLCRRGDVEKALDMVKTMRKYGHTPWIKPTSLFVEQLCENGKAHQAFSFLDNMLQEGFVPNVVSYSALLKSLVKAGEVDPALSLFRTICDKGCSPDVIAYNILINGLCKAKRVSEAEELVDEMLAKGLAPSVVTYNLLISGWCRDGDTPRAMLCLSKMYDEKTDPSVITYTTLIDGLCSMGKSDEALLVFDDMESKGCAPNGVTFMALISGLCKCRRPDTALSYLRVMEKREMVPQNFVYVVLLSAFLSESNLPMAFEIFKEIVDRGSVPDETDKNYSVMKDAVQRFLADEKTSASVRALVNQESLSNL